MQTDANVVPLNKGASELSPTSPVGRLPVALIQVRDKAAQLKQALQALFDNADDTLFQMADRATSNAEQNAFFEAMRDLRLKRKSIERGFLQKVFETFSNLNQYEIGKPPVLDAVSFESLSLVQNDELEESVALDAMVAKVMSRDGIALGHLTTRLNTLVTKKIEDKSNPLGPRALCEAFLDACRSLGVEIKVKLIIFKLFEYVLSDLDQLYAESNQALITAGVLPELKSAPPVRRPQGRTPGAARSAQAAEGGRVAGEGAYMDEGVQEVFGALQELLSQVRGSGTGAGIGMGRREVPADAVPITSNPDAPARTCSAPCLRRTQVMSTCASSSTTCSPAPAPKWQVRVVGQVDDDVINLVSMLFEFILDDRSLPDSLKALIGRLQIPMLKVAVLDKTFFSRGSHPARRLLNGSPRPPWAGASRTTSSAMPCTSASSRVVLRLLNDFVDDPTIFSDLLSDFLAYTGDERRRSDLLEQRTRDAEEGRAKAELARQQVEQALNERLLGRTLPEVVVRLLQEAWSKVMLLTCLKHGVGSEATLSTMDDLIWSVESHEAPEARMRLLELVPGLLKALREG